MTRSDSLLAVEDTGGIFWSNLEAGLSLLAVNLPSLWAYVNKATPEGIIASIRSIISLHSLRSNGSSNRSRSHIRIPHTDSRAPSGVHTGVDPDQQGIEFHALNDVDGLKRRPPMPDDVIVVKKSFVKSDEVI